MQAAALQQQQAMGHQHVLIAREAGARVLDHDGSGHSPQSHSTIAVTPALEADLMAAVQATPAE